MRTCPLDGGAGKNKSKVQAKQGEEKHKSESLMNGNSMTNCPATFGYFKLFYSTLLYTTFGSFCLLLNTFGYFLLLLATLGYFGLLLASFGYSWLLWFTFGYFCLLLATFGYFWLRLPTLSYF